MKVLKILGHPYLLIISFLLLLISGEHVGGFYVLYILLAVPHAGMHALFAVAGIGLIVLSFRGKMTPLTRAVIHIIGVIFLILSIYLFFANDGSNYNSGTFSQTIPLISFVIFGMLVICSVLKDIFSGTTTIAE